jgi:hypothetical protein
MFVLQNKRANFRTNMNMYNNKRNQEISFTINSFPHDNSNVTHIAKNNESNPKIKEMTWGEPTWYLFHTLAEKVDDRYFNQLLPKLLHFITRICNNLPCPDCTNHATNYLRSINYDKIETKEQLKHMLWTFHNVVNQRKGYMLFSYEDLNKKYSEAVTVNIIRNFFYHYSRKQYNIRLSMDNLTRRNILKELQQWLEQNSQKFFP